MAELTWRPILGTVHNSSLFPRRERRSTAQGLASMSQQKMVSRVASGRSGYTTHEEVYGWEASPRMPKQPCTKEPMSMPWPKKMASGPGWTPASEKERRQVRGGKSSGANPE